MALLEDVLTGIVRRKLVTSLNTDDRWDVIIEGLTTYRIPVFLDRDRMRQVVGRGGGGRTPSDWLLDELQARLCSFDVFCHALRQFDLIEELALLVPPEPMEVLEEPGGEQGEVRGERGDRLELVFRLSGVPRPTLQWYHDNTLLPGCNAHVLTIDNFSEEHRGTYRCRARQTILHHENERWSAEVVVDLVLIRPQLTVNLPVSRCVARGQTLTLCVRAEGYPPPSYEWFRSGCGPDDYEWPNDVLDSDSDTIEIRCAGPDDEGDYCCRVANEAGETFSTRCTLSIFEPPPDYIASAKVALLIGNERYAESELGWLSAPCNDVAVLADILRNQLGFHVIALADLTRNEMRNAFRWFANALPDNAYAFFYFAGHGFSKLASKFMMAVDCPRMSQVRLEHCLCEEQLIQTLADDGRRQLQLLVMLFDCCLVQSRNLSIGRTEFEYDLGACNVVLGTATRNHRPAYERNGRANVHTANGLFVDRLRAHLASPVPVVELLKTNQRDFKEKQQQPTTYFSGADNCSLTDPIEENPVLENKLRSELDFPTCEKELFFGKTMESFMAAIKKHRDCFMNSIDIILPDNFTHSFAVEVNSTELELSIEGKVVTISNLQKLKCPLCVTVVINGVRRQSDAGFVAGPYDSCQLTIEHPVITNGRLWHTADLTPD